jgi:hypothetical protein
MPYEIWITVSRLPKERQTRRARWTCTIERVDGNVNEVIAVKSSRNRYFAKRFGSSYLRTGASVPITWKRISSNLLIGHAVMRKLV